MKERQLHFMLALDMLLKVQFETRFKVLIRALQCGKDLHMHMRILGDEWEDVHMRNMKYEEVVLVSPTGKRIPFLEIRCDRPVP